jgi:hypothetical protein
MVTALLLVGGSEFFILQFLRIPHTTKFFFAALLFYYYLLVRFVCTTASFVFGRRKTVPCTASLRNQHCQAQIGLYYVELASQGFFHSFDVTV